MPEEAPKRSPSRRVNRAGRRLVDKAWYYGKIIGLVVGGAAYFGVEAYDKLIASKEAAKVQELVSKNKDDQIRILQEQIDAMKKQAKP